ncbi:TSUP family transporter [Porticoccaceae bacterium]|nr:TSUP family transporter [Porticoccaceae bacterium]MDC0589589.1 TSUP family transporter [Porticoccaceae bacterium]
MILLVGFSALTFIIAGIMWRQTVTTPEQANIVRSGHSIDNNLIQPICRFNPEDQFDTSYKCIGALIGCGLVVGLLSGLFGVGGGFLIVPALLSISQVSMQSPMKNSPLAGEEILFELVQSPETVINVYEVVAEASTA